MSIQTQNGRVCKLDKYKLQYVNTINFIVADVLHIPRGMTKILEHLYLGNISDAENIELLHAEGITHICNTVEGHTNKEFYGDEFQYYGFSSEDNLDYPIMDHFDAVYKFIESSRENNGKCFIHCMAGINRSGCLATAYVMLLQNIGPITAAKQIFNKRGMLLSNGGFVERLVLFADEHDLLKKDESNVPVKFAVDMSNTKTKRKCCLF